MEIKEALEEIRNSKGKTTSVKRGETILEVCQAICDGYTLCKVDESIAKIKQKAWKEESIEVEDCIDILKEACL